MAPVPVPPTRLGWPYKDRDDSPPPLLQMPPFPALPTGTVPTKGPAGGPVWEGSQAP